MIPEYPKIDTLFDRDPTTFKVDVTRFRRPEFTVPECWLMTEKVDGTNVRVSLERECSVCGGPGPSGDYFSCDTADAPHTGWVVRFYGRTAAAQMPTFLLDHLQRTFTLEKMQALWRCKNKECYGFTTVGHLTKCPKFEPYSIILYGEGYGARIQRGGGNYRKDGDVSFRLFDVFIGETWLSRSNVEDVARQLNVDPVPLIAPEEVERYGTFKVNDVWLWTTYQVVNFVGRGFASMVALVEGTPGSQAEGVVAFTDPLLFNGRGQRLMWKLKTKDF